MTEVRVDGKGEDSRVIASYVIVCQPRPEGAQDDSPGATPWEAKTNIRKP